MTRPRRPLFDTRALRRIGQRDLERLLAVLVEFVDHGRWRDPLYVPPWKYRDASGRTMGEGGPTCDGEYARKIAEYRASIEGGGLWDPSEDSPRKVIARKTRPVERPDSAAMVAFIEHHSADLDENELLVGVELYECGATLGEAAKRLGIERANVAHANRQLIRKYMKWLSRGVVMTPNRGH